MNGSTIILLIASYLMIGFTIGLLVWDSDRANLDVVHDRGRARRRTVLSVVVALTWPTALVLVAVYTSTERGHAFLRRIIFGRT